LGGNEKKEGGSGPKRLIFERREMENQKAQLHQRKGGKRENSTSFLKRKEEKKI